MSIRLSIDVCLDNVISVILDIAKILAFILVFSH
ncbi:hypothetical protein Metlim_1233 [Methanoplanus limicola DSM 2279]|uniref:Uncharacterized protein n=1 Tax=Methanoplanus limicola DSM 2279 TaxID=937775 RepID=H1Z176_9EURY|nr:hypothetical protein Metlim_1233 [Methanoplanus limicola DSM 2279]